MESTIFKRIAVSVAVGAAVFAAAAPANAADTTADVTAAKALTMHDLGGFGGVGAFAADLNDRGQVVGSAAVPGPVSHAFLWQAGKLTDLGSGFTPVAINAKGEILVNTFGTGVTRAGIWRQGTVTELGTLGGANSYAVGFNDRDEVVGSSDIADGSSRPFLWRNGTMTALPALAGGTSAAAYGINNQGIVVGRSVSRAGATVDRAVAWRNGKVSDLGVDGDATAVNDRGDITIDSMIDGHTHALLWQHGTTTDLGGFGGDPSYGFYAHAAAINDRGEITGTSNAADGPHGFVWRNGKLHDLGVFTSGNAINNRGQVAGTYQPNTVPYTGFHAVLWS